MAGILSTLLELPGARGRIASSRLETERRRHADEITLAEEQRAQSREQRDVLRDAIVDRLMEAQVAATQRAAERPDQLDPNSYEAQWNRRQAELRMLEELPQNMTRAGGSRVRPQASGGGSGLTDTRRDLATLNQQIDDNRADLTAARRRVPEGRSPLVAAMQTPEQGERFTADSTAAADQVRRLEQRGDSLGGVRDSLAAVAQGASPTSSTGSSTGTRLSVSQAEYDAIVAQQGSSYARRHFEVR